MAMAMYIQDSDGMYPWGADPSDKNTTIWTPFPNFYAEVQSMPLLTNLLTPYVQSKQVWRCPSDTGFDYLDTNIAGSTSIALNARPSMFQAFGTSYMYRTEITLKAKSDSNLAGIRPNGEEAGPSEINILMDGNGHWHGSWLASSRRYNVLMADGHAVSQNPEQYFITSSWGLKIQ
jgi:general secretion pathway protein G